MPIRAIASFNVGNANATVYEAGGSPTHLDDQAVSMGAELACWQFSSNATYVQRREEIIGGSANFLPTLTIGYYHWRVQIPTLPSVATSICEGVDSTGTAFKVQIDNTGMLSLVNAAGAVVASGDLTLSDRNRWYDIELNVNTSTTGSAELRVDRTPVLTYSNGGSPFRTSGITAFRVPGPNNNNGMVLRLQGIVIRDDTWVGKCRIGRLPPIAPGSYTSGFTTTSSGTTGLLWDAVDELVSSNDQSYIVTTGSAGDAVTFTLRDPELVIGAGRMDQIQAVIIRAFVVRNGGSDGSIKVRARQGGTNVDSAALTTGSVRKNAHMILLSAPGGGDWTIEKLKGLEAGIVENSTNKTLCRSIDVEVVYTPKIVNYNRRPPQWMGGYPCRTLGKV